MNNKFSGFIGFVANTEIEPGIFEDVVTERKYKGEILKNNQHLQVDTTTSGNFRITNHFSIVGDRYAFDHIGDIRYLVWRGTRWLVADVELAHPRLDITIGGLYNGPQADSSDDTGDD